MTSALSQTYIALHPDAPLHVPPLVATNQSVFAPQQLQGRWSVIFFGYTACPLVCPKTLSVLTAFARNPESGVASGRVQPVFVSVDPDHDSPQQLAAYLHHFDRHILGLTGTNEAVRAFARELGAGYQSAGSTIDHSTSLFVVDPKGRLAGILLRPGNPSLLLSDLTKLEQSYGESSGVN